jgi:hypothetical protein
MKINLSYVASKDWHHYQGLKEVIIYFDFYLNKMGYDVTISRNYFDNKNINIIFCSYMLSKDVSIPKNSIIYQSEDLNKTTAWIFNEDKGKRYLDMLENNSIIDYSNINLLKIKNKKKCYLPLLYCERLISNFQRKERDYLLFYGAITPYRKALLENISKIKRLKILVPEAGGDYGFLRDKLIMESMGVLNLHKNENCNALEIVRCFYPLINNVPIFSEETNDEKDLKYYNSSICFFKRNSYKDLLNLINQFQKNKKYYLNNIYKFKEFNTFEIFESCIKKII